MAEAERATDRAGRRAKRFLSPLQKYEIFLQLVRQEVTMAEAAEHWQVDRNTIARIRVVAKEGALEALAKSRPGVRTKERDLSWRLPGPTPPGWAKRSRRWRSSSCWWREKGAGAEWPGPRSG